MAHFIDGDWQEGIGESFSSYDLITHQEVWRGNQATQSEIGDAVRAAKEAFPSWSHLPVKEREHFLHLFGENLKNGEKELAKAISKESGKPLWESAQEIASMRSKITTAIEAFEERSSRKTLTTQTATLEVRHKPHGVAAIFGPFNFPGHLPNGHIIPALLAGNTVVFKGSEFTPKSSEIITQLWQCLPPGVFNMVQGGAKSGHFLLTHPHIDALFFTGSYKTGMIILDALKEQPEKIAALEMGGNNPLVVFDVDDVEAAAYCTIQSAFLTAGQRCTCARRLILPFGNEGDAFLKALIHMTENLVVGHYANDPQPFMGPVISGEAAEHLLQAQGWLGGQGGKTLLEMEIILPETPLLRPGIMDVTGLSHRPDEELFGPFLQVVRVPTFEAAIQEANRTAYGLAASLLSRSRERFNHFLQEIRAGVINWNTPTTGASGKAPFGGVGKSGNHHPSGYYAADYCAYPVASMEREAIYLPPKPPFGMTFLSEY